MTEETNTNNEQKDPVTYSDEDIKKMEEDVKKAVGEEQAKAVEDALAKNKEETARQKELDELKARQEQIEKERQEEKQKYAEDLKKIQDEAKANTQAAIDQLRNERQSTVNTDNPFKKTGESEDVKAKIRNDPAYLEESSKKAQEAFEDYYNLPKGSL